MVFEQTVQNIWASIYAFLCPKNRPRKDLTSFTKTDSKWITGVNVKFKTINLLKENIGEGSYAHHHTTNVSLFEVSKCCSHLLTMRGADQYPQDGRVER